MSDCESLTSFLSVVHSITDENRGPQQKSVTMMTLGTLGCLKAIKTEKKVSSVVAGVISDKPTPNCAKAQFLESNRAWWNMVKWNTVFEQNSVGTLDKRVPLSSGTASCSSFLEHQ